MEDFEHDLEKQIVLKLIHNPSLCFNELWAKQGESNTFAYHLNKLEKQGIVKKNEAGAYELSEEGKKLSAFIEGDTGSKADFPTFSVVLLVRDPSSDRWLCQKRLKEPFYGYWGFVSGKINFGQNLFECATRDLLEETGLHAAEWKLKALEQVKTFDGDKLLFHHYLFHLETDNSSGTLKEKTHKAEHEWLTLEEYKTRDTFPSEKFFDHIIPAEKPILLEAERYMENGKFKGMKTVSVTKF
jgi:ADP-ribose pyrophosphatase YjhB (NUDIX family)